MTMWFRSGDIPEPGGAQNLASVGRFGGELVPGQVGLDFFESP